ncbi:MAG: hypothetical protein RSF82_10765 [Angelakisella sp.]
MNNDILINHIACILHRDCLSDLHSVAVTELDKAIRQIDSHEYTLEQWSYALSYIFDRNIEIEQFNDIYYCLTLNDTPK